MGLPAGNDHGFVRVFTLNEARPQAHVRLEALLYLGSHGVQLQNNMINCLRFFRFAEKEYLLTAGQVHPQKQLSRSSHLPSSQDRD